MTRKSLVLVGDDDIALRTLTREILERTGFRVEDAATEREVIDTFQHEPPQIVLLDVTMSDTDGFATCAALRRLPKGADVPILMMIELDDVEAIAKAYDAGATDFITKPWHTHILAHRVRYMVRGSQAVDALRENERGLAEAQRISHLGSWRWDLSTNRFSASNEVFRILGIEPSMFGGTIDDYLATIHPEDQKSARTLFRQSIAQMGRSQYDHRIQHPTQGDRIVHEQTEILREPGGTANQVIGTIQDITDRRQAEAQIHFLAYYDQLTQLPNRQLFKDRVTQALTLAERHTDTGAVLLVKPDRFQRINDMLGPISGDQVLKEIAQRLIQCTRKTDSVARQQEQSNTTLSRIGGDEFTILLTHLSSPHDPAKVAQRILQALSEPFVLQDRKIELTASIGIALLNSDGLDVETLLRNANVALHAAREKGRNTYWFSAQSMNVAMAERLSLESDLRNALERDEFLLHYQPQIDIRRWEITGVEALIRWHHPVRGMVSPASFIPLADELGLIEDIGKWILQTAFRQQAAWAASGLDLSVAINLSGVQFRQSSLINTIAGLIKETGADPHKLEFELTESTSMQHAENAVATFRHLKAMGCHLAIDDFGTGYSSLAYLQRFPIDTIKIDRAFVNDLGTESEHATIATAIIAMAHGLELRVVAEGVETREQLDILRANHCDTIQGYLFSQPLPCDLLEQLVRRHRSERSPLTPPPDSLPLAG